MTAMGTPKKITDLGDIQGLGAGDVAAALSAFPASPDLRTVAAHEPTARR